MDGYLKPGVALLCLGLLRYVDTTDPDVLTTIRSIFVIGSVMTLAVHGLLYLLINQRNDTTPLTVTESDLDPNAQSSWTSMFATEGPSQKPVQTTNKEYDLIKWRAQFSPALMTPIVILALHWWKGFVPPLLIQSILPLISLVTGELSRIYLIPLVYPASIQPFPKELKRPWKAPGFMQQFKQMKKEVMTELNQGKADKQRRNKTAENRKKIGK